jgi:hypothetical protein
MYFETDDPLPPGGWVRINLPESGQGPGAADAPCLTGQTVWCRPCRDEADTHYACGVRLLASGRRMDGSDARAIKVSCDLCEGDIACEDIRRTEDGLYLCPYCHQYLQAPPNHGLNKAILSRLIGNVL